jgi:ABC-2 type transport system ATP-binding protein
VSGPVVHLADVTVRRSSRFELRVETLTIQPGLTAVIGDNASGKSTLLSVLATALSPTTGRLTLAGADAGDPAALTEIRRRLGYLPQDDTCPPRLRVFDHVDLIATAREIGTTARSRHAEVGRALRAVDLVEAAGQHCGSLSGGQRRRAAIAAAIVGDAALLVLDEPDTGLDGAQRERLADLLRMRAATATVVVASHDHRWVTAVADQRLVVSAGTVRAA